MSDDMRVLLFEGPHRLSIQRRPTPEPGPGEVRVRVGYIGICGSDLHGYTGESGRRAPGMVMGHEMSGWVDAIGPGASSPEVGTAVTINPALACSGGCGHRIENQCNELRVIGVTPDIQGAFADAIVVPADRIVRLGPVDVVAGATVEPVAVAVQAVSRSATAAGDRVLVIGGGMIGQCVARAARRAGAAEVVISERVADRRAFAERAGFLAVGPDAVRDLPLFDVTFDAVGVSATAASAIEAVRKGGTTCFVGLGVPEVSIPLFEVVVAERTVVGTFAYTDSVFEEAVAAVGAGEIEVDDFLGAVVSLEAAPRAFEALAIGDRSDVKIIVGTGNGPVP